MMVMVVNLVECAGTHPGSRPRQARLRSCASEPLGPQQGVGEVEQQPCGHEGGERIVENHGILLTAVRRCRRSPPRARTGRARWPALVSPSFGCPFRHATPSALEVVYSGIVFRRINRAG